MDRSAKPAPAPHFTDCLAGQPILNTDEKVLGYELLFRESAEEVRFSSDYERWDAKHHRHVKHHGTRCGLRWTTSIHQLHP